MRKYTLIQTVAFLFLCITSLHVNAQKRSEKDNIRQNVLKTNVLGYFAGQYQIAYEHGLNENVSVQLSAGFLSGGTTNANYKNKRTGFILIPEVHYYFNGNAPRGFYVGAFARYRHANNKLTDASWTAGGTGTDQDLSRKRKVNSIGGGAVLGYQVISRGGFTFDIFGGPQFKSRTYNTVYANADLNERSTTGGFDSLGDEFFSQKYTDFKVGEKAGMGLRFGFNFGYAF